MKVRQESKERTKPKWFVTDNCQNATKENAFYQKTTGQSPVRAIPK